MRNLMPESPATLLPADPADSASADVARPESASADVAQPESASADVDPLERAARHPTSSAAWADLAERELAGGNPVPAYAYARTGYHRGLDQLRRNGWRGAGPVPWSHGPNRGFLRCLSLLARAADAIGEADEAARCAQFLRDCDPAAADALSG